MADRRFLKGARLLNHPQDLHCLVFHFLCLAAYGLAFWLYLHPSVAHLDGPWSQAAFVVTAVLLLGWISAIDVGVNFHNHSHRRMFRAGWMNRWFGRLWTVVAGWPSFFWEYAHLVVHHGHLLEAGDWTLPRRRVDGSFESIYRYSFCHWPWRTAIHFLQDFRPGGTASKLAGRALRELVIFLALWTFPFWLDPVMAVCLWVLPHFFANVVIKGPGMYVQHVGCEPSGPLTRYRQATTSIDRFFNLTMFNIGYHIEHHAHPGVHWSELPLLHRNLRQELINEGSHVLPSGYYRWATVFLGRPTGVREAAEEFARAQDSAYGPHRGC